MTGPSGIDPLPEVVHPRSGRFVLRRYTADDAAALGRAVGASVEHLLEFMPWAADEPVTVEARREIIANWDHEWQARRSVVLGMFSGDEVIGGTGMHRRRDGRPDVIEIGYWVHVDHIRQGIAREAAGALTDAAFELPTTSAVEIHHAPTNLASRAIPSGLGYRYVGDEALRGQIFCVWRITRDEWRHADS